MKRNVLGSPGLPKASGFPGSAPLAVPISRRRVIGLFSLMLLVVLGAVVSMVYCSGGFYRTGKIAYRALHGDSGWNPEGINRREVNGSVAPFELDSSLPRVGIVVFVGSELNAKMSWMWRLSYHNKLAYVKRRGYDLIVENEELINQADEYFRQPEKGQSAAASGGSGSGNHSAATSRRKQSTGTRRPLGFGKIVSLKKWLSHYQWLMWIDVDTLIHRFDVGVESFLNDRADVVMSEDWNGINSGVFFLRNSPYSHRLLEEVWNTDPRWWLPHGEQSAIVRVVEENIHYSTHRDQHWIYPPQRLFNAFSPLIATGESHSAYHNGDFLIHYPSCGNLGLRICRKDFEQHFHDACYENNVPNPLLSSEAAEALLPPTLGGHHNQSWFGTSARAA